MEFFNRESKDSIKGNARWHILIVENGVITEISLGQEKIYTGY